MNCSIQGALIVVFLFIGANILQRNGNELLA
jgi:hypothetical protein